MGLKERKKRVQTMGRSFFLGRKFAKSLESSGLYLSKKKMDVDSATSYAIVNVDAVPNKSHAIMSAGDFPAFQKSPVCFTFWETEAGKTFVKAVTPYTTVGDSAKAVSPYISTDSLEDAAKLAALHENRRAGPPPALDKFVATHFDGEWEMIGKLSTKRVQGGRSTERGTSVKNPSPGKGHKTIIKMLKQLLREGKDCNKRCCKCCTKDRCCKCCTKDHGKPAEPPAASVVHPVTAEESASPAAEEGGAVPAEAMTQLDVPLLSRGTRFPFASAMDREQLTLSTLTARSVL
jgi:hypothetical protein